jgi:hypothetical protein
MPFFFSGYVVCHALRALWWVVIVWVSAAVLAASRVGYVWWLLHPHPQCATKPRACAG